jgi:hypothetical protein
MMVPGKAKAIAELVVNNCRVIGTDCGKKFGGYNDLVHGKQELISFLAETIQNFTETNEYQDA